MKKYYKNIDFIRVLACISILLYHLNILKGGYLAVCTFFVLSGYLSCISAFKKEKFSLKDYYFNRLLKLYLPLIIVVFVTVSIISFIPSIAWFNLKPETTSVLLGYNNFWQLSANLDYFARHISSPFIHLWYISILLQFDLIFPFVYLGLRKIENKFNKIIPCIITTLLALLSTIFFYKSALTENIMITYYSTFTRMFSLFFGLSLGLIHTYYNDLIQKSLRLEHSKKIFYAYMLILISLFIFIDSKSVFFPISMILSTLIACRLIDYSRLDESTCENIFDKVIKFISSISYEIYLVQYPVIFLFQYVGIANYLKLLIILPLIIILSYIFHFALNYKNPKLKLARYITFSIISIISIFGFYKYLIAKDHTKEMNLLKEQLKKNQELIQKNQEEYASKIQEEQEGWLSTLEDLENAEKGLENVVLNFNIVGIGDSVMLGAVPNLYEKFRNGYFDAQISRTAWAVNDILINLKNRNILGEPIVLNLGANGDCSNECKTDIMKTSGDREVFWINTTNDTNVNKELEKFAMNYDNLHIIDWKGASSGHYDYFASDGIHLTNSGKYAYVKTIYDWVYQVYLEKYQSKKEEAIKNHEEELKNKISFYGNDILLNAFDYIKSDFRNSKFNINEDYNFNTLKDDLTQAIKNNTLNYKVILAFDENVSLTKENYEELIELCKDKHIYILATNSKIKQMLAFEYENVKIIDFYKEIKNNDNYLMVDKIHLTHDGNIALGELLKEVINN